MLPVMTAATGCGMPMWRSMKRRKTRPSFSRKKVLKKKNDRKNATDVSPSMPWETPWRSVLPMSGTAVLTSWLALSAPLEPTPRSLAQSAIRSAPALRAAVISAPLAMMPPITIRATTAATTSRPSSTRPAAAARGMCRDRRATPGAVTAATIAAANTGPTIVEIRPRNQTRPKISRPTPTRNQAIIPNSRSHAGAASMWAS